jgi:DNA transposition AAA+ family ATPase
MSSAAETFVETQEYQRFKEFCDACRDYQYIGLCYGVAGVGKTLSARHYADWDRLTAFLERRQHNGIKLPEVLHCDVVFFTASAAVANAPAKIDRSIHELRDSLIKLRHLKIQEEEEGELFAKHDRMIDLRDTPRGRGPWRDDSRPPAVQAQDEFIAVGTRYAERCRQVRDTAALLIVDEVDLLKMAGLEQLRAIFDRGGIGLVLIGMPGLEKRLARYPQLYSRVGFAHEFRSLRETEIRDLLRQGWNPSGAPLPSEGMFDERGLAVILRTAEGNFRVLNQLLTQIERVMKINNLRQVTPAVVEVARDSLVIGTA